GLLGRLALNYKGLPSIDITVDNLSSIDMDVFLPNGRIYSYACRTGIAKLGRKFNSDEEADPKNSLAQKMADHFKVDVYAFLTRTYYGNVLREKSDSERISSALKKARQTRDGEIIDIPPEHEGLPHPGLYEGGWFSSTDEEGTDEYALWRKQGAIRMPSAGDTPKGLSKSMRRFTPT
ncbi:MAG: hypothetical protein SVR94_12750, partial [Pseudomonadota bacterium]|nr:hypothetical protein [Pseudomonadota bacterium]